MIDKIIEELEKLYFPFESNKAEALYNVFVKDAIEIAKKYENDDWISIDDRLPSYDTRVLVTFTTDKGSIGIEDCWYSLINRCFETYKDFEKIPLDIKILAWRPLPQPYKEV